MAMVDVTVIMMNVMMMMRKMMAMMVVVGMMMTTKVIMMMVIMILDDGHDYDYYCTFITKFSRFWSWEVMVITIINEMIKLVLAMMGENHLNHML